MRVLIALLLVQSGPEAEYRQRLDKVLKNGAARHYSVGEYLRTSQMHQWAREQYLRAIALDPDHEHARKRLGYLKGEGGWAVDPDAKIETANRRKDADADRIRKSLDDRLEQAGRDLGRQWAELAAWCRKSMLPKEAEAAYRRCLESDPDHASARKELGYEKRAGGGWMTKAEREFRAEMRDGLAKSGGGTAVEGDSAFRGIVGAPTRMREGLAVLVETTHLKDPQMAEVVRRADHAVVMFRKAFGPVSALGGSGKLRLLVLKDQGQHQRFVRAHFQGPQLELALKARAAGGGGAAEIWQGDAPDLLVYDWAVHTTMHALLREWTKPEHCWLYEGLGLHFSKLMQDTAHVYCVDLAGTRTENQGKRFTQPEEWPSICKVWVRDGTDPDLAAVLKCTSFAELDGAETVKGWSLTDFLLAEHREAFGRFIEALRGKDVEAAAKEAFGWTLPELDERWRAYVRANY